MAATASRQHHQASEGARSPPPGPPEGKKRPRTPPLPARRQRGQAADTESEAPPPLAKQAYRQHRGLTCEVCGAVIKGTGHPAGDSAALQSHMRTSSRCLALRGHGQGKEPCSFGCGKMLAAGDMWAAEQHSWHCKKQQRWTWRP